MWDWARLTYLCEIERDFQEYEIEWDQSDFERDLLVFVRLSKTYQPLLDWEGLTSLLSRTPCLSWRLGVRTHGGRHTLYLNGSHILGSCTELYFLCKPGINVINFKSISLQIHHVKKYSLSISKPGFNIFDLLYSWIILWWKLNLVDGMNIYLQFLFWPVLSSIFYNHRELHLQIILCEIPSTQARSSLHSQKVFTNLN